jgi:hypothetical protein
MIYLHVHIVILTKCAHVIWTLDMHSSSKLNVPNVIQYCIDYFIIFCTYPGWSIVTCRAG